MADIFDENGLQLDSLETLRTQLVNGFQSIYGTDINTDSNTPDGQMINIFAQAGIDIRELIQQINASFDPDQASGRILDQRVAINGITRNGPTFTQTPISITTDRALNLIGLDTASNELNPTVSGLYTVKDDAGTEYYLLSSVSIPAAGTQSLTFRAAEIGVVQTVINTITTPVTVIAGVTAVNNPLEATVVGRAEESDASLKVRRRAATSIPALGTIDALEGRLQDLDNVSFARVYENNTDSTDTNGTPARTIWTIVEGGDDDAIAETIYETKPPGPGMRGTQVVNVNRPTLGGLPQRVYPVRFDRPISQDLHIRFTLTFPAGNFDEDVVKAAIVANVVWEVGQTATGDVVTAFLKGFNSDYIITNMEVSDDGTTYAETVEPTNINYRFVNASARITIS